MNNDTIEKKMWVPIFDNNKTKPRIYYGSLS